MNEPTLEGRTKIDRWQKVILQIERLKDQLSSADCELVNATNDLAKWLSPADMKVGETIGVWYGDAIISVTKTNSAGGLGKFDFTIKTRSSGHKANLL